MDMNEPNPPSPPVFQPTDVIGVRLEAREWNVVIEALHNLPYRAVVELIPKLCRQCVSGVAEN